MTGEIVWLLVPVGIAWLLVLAHRGVRAAYANGWHCLVRHRALWQIPAGFAAAYALFDAAGRMAIGWRMEEPPPLAAPLILPEIPEIAVSAILPAFESLASGLNCLIATFPVSALCGALFLINFQGLTGEMRRTACKQYGAAGLIAFALLVVCALCAALKPLLILGFPELALRIPLQWLIPGGTAANALSFVFEYLLGTCLQIGLILLACGWVRGLRFDPGRLTQFAVRRLGFVFQWSLVIIMATLALIHLPMLIPAASGGEPAPSRFETPARIFLAAAMIGFCTVQVRLILHNDTLRGAVASHGKFIRRNAPGLCIFLFAAYSLIWIMKLLESSATAALGPTISGMACGALFQIPAAVGGGWILAAWACFYKGSESGSQPIVY